MAKSLPFYTIPRLGLAVELGSGDLILRNNFFDVILNCIIDVITTQFDIDVFQMALQI